MIPGISRRSQASAQRGARSRQNVVRIARAMPRAGGLVTKAQVKQMIVSRIDREAEDKYFDTVGGGGAAVTYNGTTPFSITDIAQGASDTSRVGDALVAKRLRWRSLATYNLSATQSASINILRLVVFVWKPFFADVAPTVAKVMTYTGTQYAAQSYLTHDGIDQIKVLFDQVVVMDSFHRPTHFFQFDIALNHIIQYKAASTTNQSSGIYAFYISDVASGGPVVPSTATRLDYQDA